jgi:hypothetical protein
MRIEFHDPVGTASTQTDFMNSARFGKLEHWVSSGRAFVKTSSPLWTQVSKI